MALRLLQPAVEKPLPLLRETAPKINKYDTALSPQEETIFQEWKSRNAPHDSGIDYDLRGAFKAGVQPAEDGHWPDTFKKPNHPTFSVESKYAKDAPQLAGRWDGETYIPSNRTAPDPRASLSFGQKILTNPAVSKIIDTVSGGMSPQEADVNAFENVSRWANYPKVLPPPSLLTNPAAAMQAVKKITPMTAADAANEALGVVAAPFLPAAGAMTSAIHAPDKTNIPAILQQAFKGAIAPQTAPPLLKGITDAPLTEFERGGSGAGAVARLIPRAMMHAAEQVALAAMLGVPCALKRGYTEAKVKGVERDFNKDFSKIEQNPEIVSSALEKQGLFPRGIDPAEKAELTTAIIARLKAELRQNPKIGDLYMKKQTPLKILKENLPRPGLSVEDVSGKLPEKVPEKAKPPLIPETPPVALPKPVESSMPSYYHGTDRDFDVFDLNQSKAFGESKFGHWFTEGKEFASMFGKNVKEVNLEIKNPKIISKDEWDKIREDHAKDGNWFKQWKESLIAQGYDGLKVNSKKERLGKQDVETPSIVAAFQDKQISVIAPSESKISEALKTGNFAPLSKEEFEEAKIRIAKTPVEKPTIDQAKKWIIDTLVNDKSTDAELVKYFQKEGGFDKDIAEKIVAQRGKTQEISDEIIAKGIVGSWKPLGKPPKTTLKQPEPDDWEHWENLPEPKKEEFKSEFEGLTDKQLVKELASLVSNFDPPQMIMDMEGNYSNASSSWLKPFANRGYTKKYLQNIYNKYTAGEKLTEKQANDLIYTLSEFKEMFGLKQSENMPDIVRVSDIRKSGINNKIVQKIARALSRALSPGKVKGVVQEQTGLKKDTEKVQTESQALKQRFTQQAKGSQYGFKEGRRQVRAEQKTKKQERARMIEAAKRFPREQRFEIYKAARKAGLILPEKKDPATGKVIQPYKNKLSPLLRFYNKASFTEVMDYIRALRGDPDNPPLVFKLSGDPAADAESMKLIEEASGEWNDINRVEIGTLDLPRIVEKVSGLEVFEDNILADNTYEPLKGADDARLEKAAEMLQELEDNAKEFAAQTKASADLMRKFESGEGLNEKEKKAADYLRSKYDELIKQANENRERLGKKPIPYRKDYMTHINDWNMLTEFFKGDQKAMDNLTNEQWQALAKGQYSKISVPFNKFAQERTGKKTKFDAIGNYKKYLETMLYEIYLAPAIKHVRTFTDYALLKQPNAKIAIDQLLDELTGKPSSFDHIALRPFFSNPLVKWLNARFGANALIGNISYYITNASNIATASGELGNYTVKGMHGFLSNPYLRQLAFEKSSILKSRKGLFDYEISRIEAFFSGHGKQLTSMESLKLKDRQLEYVISSINRIIEYNNVGSAWVGAYMKAIEKFKFSPKKAYGYADSVARKTQGGYRPYEMPGWMRSDVGKIASKFGTWAFNMMNYFLYDLKMANIPENVASVVTKAPRKEVSFGKFIVLTATLMFVNALYEKMKLRKPYSVKSFTPQTPLTRGRYEQPPAGRVVEDVKTLLPLEGKRKEKPETRQKAMEELFFMLGPRYGGAQLRRFFHGDILPSQKKESKEKLRLLNN